LKGGLRAGDDADSLQFLEVNQCAFGHCIVPIVVGGLDIRGPDFDPLLLDKTWPKTVRRSIGRKVFLAQVA
jgi:hypothetical protein